MRSEYERVEPDAPMRAGHWKVAGIALIVAALPAGIGVAAVLSLVLDERSSMTASPLVQVALAGIVAPMFLAGIRMLNRGRRITASATLSDSPADARDPVLYLRSFAADDRLSAPSEVARVVPFATATMEESLVEALQKIGPVVAIGRPGEQLPPLGARRHYVAEDEWQSAVLELMSRARLVVIVLGATQGLAWEIDQSLHCVPPRRLVFYGGTADYKTLLATPRHPFPRPVELPRRRMHWLHPPDYLLHFDDDWTPHFERLRNPATIFRTSLRNPLLPVFNHALRPVFMRLRLPWSPLPVPWVPLLIVLGFLVLLFGTLFYLALTQG